MKKLIISILFLLWSGTALANEYDNAFWKLTPTQLFALTLYGEARGESVEGKIAVGTIILERTRSGNSIKRTILQPQQFSCFSPNDRQYYRLNFIAEEWKYSYKQSRQLRECFAIAKGLVNGTITGHRLLLENRATHFKTISVKPEWSKKMNHIITIGGHQFYAETSRRKYNIV